MSHRLSFNDHIMFVIFIWFCNQAVITFVRLIMLYPPITHFYLEIHALVVVYSWVANKDNCNGIIGAVCCFAFDSCSYFL